MTRGSRRRGAAGAAYWPTLRLEGVEISSADHVHRAELAGLQAFSLDVAPGCDVRDAQLACSVGQQNQLILHARTLARTRKQYTRNPACTTALHAVEYVRRISLEGYRIGRSFLSSGESAPGTDQHTGVAP